MLLSAVARDRPNWVIHLILQSFIVLIAILSTIAIFVLVWNELNKPAKLDTLNELLKELEGKATLFQLLSEKGQPDGYTPLNNASVVPDIHLPPQPTGIVFDRGCWNATSNIPFLQSSVGEDGDMYTVCAGGTTLLNGETEWKYRDRVFFLGSASSWIRLDGGRMTLDDASPVVGSEQSLVAENTGPDMKMRKVAGGPRMNVTYDNSSKVITFSRSDPFPGNYTVTMLSSVGGGVSAVVDGVGPDLDIRGFNAVGDLSISSDGDTIFITASNASTPTDDGFTNIPMQFLGYVFAPASRRFLYYGVGNNYWLGMQPITGIVKFLLIDPNGVIVTKTPLAGSPSISNLVYTFGQAGTVLAGTGNSMFDVGCGCFVSSTFTGTNSANAIGETIALVTDGVQFGGFIDFGQDIHINQDAPVFIGPT